MTIERIDARLCTGCGICVSSCPMDVIEIDDNSKKAVIKYPDDCVLCEWCRIDCPENAVFISPEKRSPMFNTWG